VQLRIDHIGGVYRARGVSRGVQVSEALEGSTHFYTAGSLQGIIVGAAVMEDGSRSAIGLPVVKRMRIGIVWGTAVHVDNDRRDLHGGRRRGVTRKIALP
jgi:hypothetical protein